MTDEQRAAVREAMLSLMSEYSENYWAASWMCSLDKDIWLDANDENAKHCRTLGELLGEWPTDYCGGWIPLDEWRASL